MVPPTLPNPLKQQEAGYYLPLTAVKWGKNSFPGLSFLKIHRFEQILKSGVVAFKYLQIANNFQHKFPKKLRHLKKHFIISYEGKSLIHFGIQSISLF